MKAVITRWGGFLVIGHAGAAAERQYAGGQRQPARSRFRRIVLFDMASSARRCTPHLRQTGDPACGNDKQRGVEATLGGDTNAVSSIWRRWSAAGPRRIELGYRVNLDGTRGLLDACRKQAKPLRFIFTSSVAVWRRTA